MSVFVHEVRALPSDDPGKQRRTFSIEEDVLSAADGWITEIAHVSRHRQSCSVPRHPSVTRREPSRDSSTGPTRRTMIRLTTPIRSKDSRSRWVAQGPPLRRVHHDDENVCVN